MSPVPTDSGTEVVEDPNGKTFTVTSRVEFRVTKEDNEVEVTCTVDHESLQNSERSTTQKLQVHCTWGDILGGVEVQQTPHSGGGFRDTEPVWCCHPQDTSLHSFPLVSCLSPSPRALSLLWGCTTSLILSPFPIPCSLWWWWVRDVGAPPGAVPTSGCCHPTALHTRTGPGVGFGVPRAGFGVPAVGIKILGQDLEYQL